MKANLTAYLSLLSCVMWLQSCRDNHAVADVCSPGNVRDVAPDEVFSTVELIPLEFTGENYPNSVSDLRVEDNRIFIADNHNTVYVFSDSGAYYGCSNNMSGAGPEEYAVSMGFSWNPHSGCVELLTPTEMLSYDDHFTKLAYKSVIPANRDGHRLTFSKIYDLSSTEHLLLPAGISENPFRVYSYDSETEKISEVFSYQDDVICPLNMQEVCFQSADSGRLIFLPPAYTQCLFTYDASALTFARQLHFDLAGEYISAQEVAGAGGNIGQLMKSGKEMILRKFISSDRLIVLSSHGSSVRDMSVSFFNVNAGQTGSRIALYADGKPVFPMIQYADGNYAYAALEGEIIRENPQLVQGFTNDVDATLAAIEPESLVLLKYGFKTS